MNFDLARYRVASFSLARPQYILVGSVWLGLTFFGVFLLFLGAVVTYRMKASKLKRAGDALTLAGGCIWFLNNAVQFLEPDRTLLLTWIYVPQLILIELLAFGLFLHAFMIAKEEPSTEETTPKRASLWRSPWVPGAILYSLMIFSFWSILYVQIFRSVESSRGGGKHPKAHIVFRPDQGNLKVALGSFALDDSLRTKENVIVVFVDTDFVILVSEEQHTASETKRTLSIPLWKRLFDPFADKSDAPWSPVLVNKAFVASIQYD